MNVQLGGLSLQPRPDPPDLEAARQVAAEMVLDTTFHETANMDPFAAEAIVHEWGRRLIRAVGWPEEWTFYE